MLDNLIVAIRPPIGLKTDDLSFLVDARLRPSFIPCWILTDVHTRTI